MKLSILLHMYQPPTQEERVFRQVYTDCYLPLLRYIKSEKRVTFTLNVPLSLLEQMDRYGYSSWIEDIKELYENDRIEVVGSSAYHNLLTWSSAASNELQILQNEIGLGYYLGMRQGFEGEPSVMVKDIGGFFPPELAINDMTVKLLDGFGYSWVLVDEVALTPEYRVSNQNFHNKTFILPDTSVKVVVRERSLSNMLSFKRDLSLNDIQNYLAIHQNSSVLGVVALDAETFGHHYKDGIFLLESFVNQVLSFGISVDSVSTLVQHCTLENLSSLVESSWGASDNDMAKNIPYPYWLDPSNLLHEDLKSLQGLCDVILEQVASSMPATSLEESGASVYWTSKNTHVLGVLNNLLKFSNSDKYWWCSKKVTFDNETLLNPGMVLRSVKYMSEVFESTALTIDSSTKEKALTLIDRITQLLK